MTDTEAIAERARAEIAEMAVEIARLRSERDASDRIGEHLLNRLVIAYENTVGCVVLTRADLAIPLVTVARSLFEALIATYWASLHPEAEEAILAAHTRELMRIMRKNLKEGRAKIVNRVTGEVLTDQFLDDSRMKKLPWPRRFDEMAKEAGILNIYDQLYGVLSMYAHGTATELIVSERLHGTPPIAANFAVAQACLRAIHLICVNHIRRKTTTDRSELERILKIPLSA